MAHVALVEKPKGLIPRIEAVYSLLLFGIDVEPMQAAAHHRGVLTSAGLLETAA